LWDAFGNGLGHFRDESSAKTVAYKNKIGEGLPDDEIHNGLHALRMVDIFVSGFSITHHSGRKNLVTCTFEVPLRRIPGRAIVPGAVRVGFKLNAAQPRLRVRS